MSDACRLCGGRTVERFRLTVLGRHEVGYLRCDQCDSLQTEQPYWLDEAYTTGALTDLDTGAVLRGLDDQAAVVSVLEALGLPLSSSVLDFGGGTGLLCRLLRDAGIDAWLFEPRGNHPLSPGFEVDAIDQRRFDLVCAFEVVEHLVEPGEVLGSLLSSGSVVLLGTQPYLGQDESWWYLTPATGQHVFFCAPAAFAWLARTHRVQHLAVAGYQLFAREPLPRWRQRLLTVLLSGRVLRLQRARLAYCANYDAAQRDSGLYP